MSLILSGTDGLSDVDGTAATPAIRGTDANTGIFFPAADTIAFSEGGVEAARIDSSGNLGLGVTPSAISQGRALQVLTQGYGLWNGSGSPASIYLTANTYFDSSFKYGETGPATTYYQYQGTHVWNTAPSGTAGNAITFTQAMTLDASGQLQLGTTAPISSANANDTVLTLKGKASPRNGYIELGNFGTTGNDQSLGYLNFYDGTTLNSALEVARATSTSTAYMRFSTNNGSGNTERMRLDSSGNLLVGKTTNNDTSTGCVIIPTDVNTGRFKATGDNSASGASFQVTNTSGNNTFLVRPNGNVTNTNNSYGAISDAKLKENIVDATPKLAGLMQVKVRNYNLIGTDKKQIGVIAQELETVFPSMVEESPDEDKEGNRLAITTKSVKYSVFVPMLIKAIQEQQALIQSLTTRITALEQA